MVTISKFVKDSEKADWGGSRVQNLQIYPAWLLLVFVLSPLSISIKSERMGKRGRYAWTLRIDFFAGARKNETFFSFFPPGQKPAPKKFKTDFLQKFSVCKERHILSRYGRRHRHNLSGFVGVYPPYFLRNWDFLDLLLPCPSKASLETLMRASFLSMLFCSGCASHGFEWALGFNT